MELLNLTPHAIVVRTTDGTDTTYPASGELARVSVETTVIDTVNGIDIVANIYGEVVNVPPVGGECFLVSSMVLDRLDVSYRGQAFAPDTGPSALRNDKGHIIAVTRLRTV